MTPRSVPDPIHRAPAAPRAVWPVLALLASACGDDHRIGLAGAGPDAPIAASPDPDAGAIPADGTPDAPPGTPVDAAPDAPPTPLEAGVDGPPVAIDAAADAPTAPPDAAPPVVNVQLADVVVDAPGATGTGTGDPARAINGVRGAGKTSGSTDVFSLGYVAGGNDHVTLRWSAGRLRNGPGADFVVFENPFVIGAGPAAFMDLIIVEVSIDGVEFRELPHRYTAPDPTVYRNDPSLWQGFAGRTPVLLNIDTHPVDPFDPAAAGGDAVDLDSVPGDDAVAHAIRSDGVRFVRLVSASARINPDTLVVYVHDRAANGPDIDGMYGRYLQAE
jgi:hypothetical protein